MTISILTDTPR